MLLDMLTIMRMALMMTEKKKKKVSAYTKATERMNRETARAVAHVQLLDELYKQISRQRHELMTKNV